MERGQKKVRVSPRGHDGLFILSVIYESKCYSCEEHEP